MSINQTVSYVQTRTEPMLRTYSSTTGRKALHDAVVRPRSAVPGYPRLAAGRGEGRLGQTYVEEMNGWLNIS